MKFEDLSQWDLDLIKSVAISLFTSTKVTDRYEALADSTLRCIHARGYDVIPSQKDLLRVMVSALPPKQGYGTSRHEPTATEIIREVFEYLKICKYDLVKNEKRESTWSTPKTSWYANNDAVKKSWQF